MKQTMLLKLAPTEDQHRALLDTMHAFNAASTHVAEIAYAKKTANKFELQKLVYGELRTTYKLPAQLAIRAISKASEAYKRDKSIQPSFRPEGAIVYDPRIMAFKGLNTVSLITLSGRVLVPFPVGRDQEARIDRIKGQAIAIEDLRHIRKRTEGTVRRSQRAKHSCWSFGQLRLFLSYKAALAGVPLHTVDPRNTSRTCSRCRHCAKENRKSQASFCCVNCGHTDNADRNAAINISRADVMRPIASGRAQVQAAEL